MAKLKPDYIQWVLTLNASGAQKEMQRLKESNNELKDSNKNLQKEMNKLLREGKANTEEFRRLGAQIRQNNTTIRENNAKMKEAEKQLDKNTMSANQLQKKMKDLKNALNNTVKALQPERYRALEKELRETQKAYDKATEGSKKFNGSLSTFGKLKTAVVGWIGAIVAAIATLGTALRTIIDFEHANSKLAAILGTTKEGIKELTAEAKRLGATTAYTASQVTLLQVELAKLGFLKDDIIAMTPAVMKFATAVDTDLASAAALAGAAIRMFGLEAKDADRVLSTLAIGTTSSALSFEYLANSLSTVGPVAAAFGFSIEEVTALLGTLANVGFDASSAATATRNILLNMADSSGKLAKALGQPVTNLDELVKGLKKLQSEGVNLAEALELTDKRSVAAFESFLKGSDTLLTLRNSVTGAEDAFDAMSEEMGNDVQGALNILSSTIEGLIMRFYESKGVIRDVIEAFTSFVEWVSNAIEYMSRFTDHIKIAATTFGIYWTAVKAAALYQKALNSETAAGIVIQKSHNAVMLLGKVAVLTFQAAIALCTGNLSRCTAALRLMRMELLKNPYTAVAVVITTVLVAAYTALRKEVNETTESQKRQMALQDKIMEKYSEEEAKIKTLVSQIHDQNLANDVRKQKLEELKQIIPGYNALITDEGTIMNDNTEAINNYLVALEKKIRLEASEDELKELYKKRRAKQKEVDEKQGEYSDARTDEALHGNQINPFIKSIISATTGTSLENAKDALDAARGELTDIDNEIAALNKQIAADTEEVMKTFGKTKPDKTTTSTSTGNRYADPKTDSDAENDKVKKATADIDRAHEERMLAIHKAAVEENMTQSELTLKETEELIRYYEERNAALLKLQEETPAKEEKVHEKIKKEVNRANAEIFDAEVTAEDARIGMVEEKRNRAMEIENAYYKEQKDAMETAVVERRITQEEADAYMLQVNMAHSNKMVEIQQQYSDDIAAIETKSAERSALLQEKASIQLRASLMQKLRDATAIAEEVRKAMESDPSADGMAAAHDRAVAEIKAKYDALIEVARKNGLDITALERAKNDALIEEDYQYQEKIYQIQQELGVSWQQEYDHELAELKKMHSKGLISERQFQKKKLQMQMQNVKKYFDYYSNLSSSAIEAIQNAEIAQVEAKYDVLIQEAENNGEDTAALEEEKANKKLEIEKKYADLNFAVKCSQIIADTAVSIMQAYAQLGPIGGSVAAALMGVTGAAQLVAAKAERDKIKNMSFSNTGKSGKTPAVTAERVVKSGYAEGGYTGDGGKYEVAGVVHKGEYVVPQWLMGDKRVMPAVEMIEALRNQNFVSQRPSSTGGYAEGGYTGNADNSDMVDAVKMLTKAAASLKNVKAYMVYQDFEKSEKLITDARNKFTRNK